MIHLILPYPPPTNHLYPTIHNGHRLLSKRGRDYVAWVGQECLVQLVGIRRPLEGWLEAWITFYPPDKRRRDADGSVKLLWDSLEKAGLYLNDYQISEYHVSRRAPMPPGRVEVRLHVLP